MTSDVTLCALQALENCSLGPAGATELAARVLPQLRALQGLFLSSNALEDAFYGLPVDTELAASTTQQLSAPSKCVFRWFTEHVAPNPIPKAPPKTPPGRSLHNGLKTPLTLYKD